MLARIVEEQAIEIARLKALLERGASTETAVPAAETAVPAVETAVSVPNAVVMLPLATMTCVVAAVSAVEIEHSISASRASPQEPSTDASPPAETLPQAVGRAGMVPMAGGLISVPPAGASSYAYLAHFNSQTQFRHSLKNPDATWVGVYTPERGGIVYNGTVFQSISSFALAHHRSVNPDYPACNGKRECEYKEGAVWTDLPR